MCVKIPCGYSLQTLTEKIACLEIVLGIACIIIIGLSGIMIFVFPHFVIDVMDGPKGENATRSPDDEVSSYELRQFLSLNLHTKAILLLLAVLYFLSGVALGFLLLTAAQFRDLKKLRMWTYLQSIACVLRLFLCIYFLYISTAARRTDVGFACFLVIMYAGFLIATVQNFVEEVRIENITSRKKKEVFLA